MLWVRSLSLTCLLLLALSGDSHAKNQVNSKADSKTETKEKESEIDSPPLSCSFGTFGGKSLKIRCKSEEQPMLEKTNLTRLAKRSVRTATSEEFNPWTGKKRKRSNLLTDFQDEEGGTSSEITSNEESKETSAENLDKAKDNTEKPKKRNFGSWERLKRDNGGHHNHNWLELTGVDAQMMEIPLDNWKPGVLGNHRAWARYKKGNDYIYDPDDSGEIAGHIFDWISPKKPLYGWNRLKRDTKPNFHWDRLKKSINEHIAVRAPEEDQTVQEIEEELDSYLEPSEKNQDIGSDKPKRPEHANFQWDRIKKAFDWERLKRGNNPDFQWERIRKANNPGYEWDRLKRFNYPDFQWERVRKASNPGYEWDRLKRPEYPNYQWDRIKKDNVPSFGWDRLKKDQSPGFEWDRLKRGENPNYQWDRIKKGQNPNYAWDRLRRSDNPDIQQERLAKGVNPAYEWDQLKRPDPNDSQWERMRKTDKAGFEWDRLKRPESHNFQWDRIKKGDVEETTATEETVPDDSGLVKRNQLQNFNWERYRRSGVPIFRFGKSHANTNNMWSGLNEYTSDHLLEPENLIEYEQGQLDPTHLTPKRSNKHDSHGYRHRNSRSDPQAPKKDDFLWTRLKYAPEVSYN